MSTLISLGTHPLYYHSQSACVTTDDGTLFEFKSAPFGVYSTCVAAAHNSNNTVWLAASNTGLLSVSTNQGTSWSSYVLMNRMISVRSISHTGDRFLITGHVKLPNLDEHAVVLESVSGANNLAWTTVFELNNPHSAVTAVASVSDQIWLAVGYKHSQPQPLIIRSMDAGVTWTEISTTALPPTALLSVGYNTVTQNLHVGGNKFTAHSAWSDTGFSWTVSPLGDQPVIDMKFNATHVLALAGNSVWFSLNSVDWQPVPAPPGHSFTSMVEYDQQWWLGSHSILNQFTGFVMPNTPRFGSPVELEGYNNGVQAHVQWVS